MVVVCKGRKTSYATSAFTGQAAIQDQRWGGAEGPPSPAWGVGIQRGFQPAQGGPRDQRIEIVGGLPTMPLGPNDSPIIMPELNGANGPAIDGLPAPVAPAAAKADGDGRS